VGEWIFRSLPPGERVRMRGVGIILPDVIARSLGDAAIFLRL
jgi:hypothetical protein